MKKEDWDQIIRAYKLLSRDLKNLKTNINVHVWNEICLYAGAADKSLNDTVAHLQMLARMNH